MGSINKQSVLGVAVGYTSDNREPQMRAQVGFTGLGLAASRVVLLDIYILLPQQAVQASKKQHG